MQFPVVVQNGSGKGPSCTMKPKELSIQIRSLPLTSMALLQRHLFSNMGQMLGQFCIQIVLQKLAALNSNGYKLVIFTNQSAIGRAKSSREKTVAEKTSRLDGFIIKVHFSIVPSSTWTHLIKSKVLQGDMLNNGQNY